MLYCSGETYRARKKYNRIGRDIVRAYPACGFPRLSGHEGDEGGVEEPGDREVTKRSSQRHQVHPFLDGLPVSSQDLLREGHGSGS